MGFLVGMVGVVGMVFGMVGVVLGMVEAVGNLFCYFKALGSHIDFYSYYNIVLCIVSIFMVPTL